MKESPKEDNALESAQFSTMAQLSIMAHVFTFHILLRIIYVHVCIHYYITCNGYIRTLITLCIHIRLVSGLNRLGPKTVPKFELIILLTAE